MRDTAIRNTHPSVVTINGDTEAWDANGNVVALDESLIQAEVIRLQAIYDSQEYARSRKAEYDKLNQDELRFDDLENGTTVWQDTINEIKGRYPK
jgi:hypothetical protein